MSRDTIEAVKTLLDRREQRNRKDHRAIVIDLTPTVAMIQIGGSNKRQEAAVTDGLSVEIGDKVNVVANNSNQRVRWVITGIVERRRPGYLTGVDKDYTELFPPNNVRQASSRSDSVAATWDYPYGSDVTFEVQTANDDEGTGTTTILLTKGSYAIIDTSATIYLRVRSIAPDGQQSSWSDWLELAPTISTVSNTHVEIAFDYTDTTIAIITAALGTLIKRVDVIVEVAFNAAATLIIGEPGDTDRLFATTEADLTQLGTYTTHPLYTYPGEQPISGQLTTAATAGSGRIILHF